MEAIWLGGNASELLTRKRTASRVAEVAAAGHFALAENPQQQAHGLEELEAAGVLPHVVPHFGERAAAARRRQTRIFCPALGGHSRITSFLWRVLAVSWVKLLSVA